MGRTDAGDRLTDGAYLLRHLFYAGVVAGLLVPAVFGDPRTGAVRRLLAWRPLAFVGSSPTRSTCGTTAWLDWRGGVPSSFAG